MTTTRVSTFRTAREFLAALDPLDEKWAPAPNRWIFRGHEDDRYELVPAAMRRNANLTFEDSDRRPLWGAYNERLLAEYQAVQRFCDLADEQGLPIGGLTARMLGQTLRSNVMTYLNQAAEGNEHFPRPEDYGMFALAQHYGIPTRLLDWSHSPYVAAWFAARGAARLIAKRHARPNRVPEFISIWAFDKAFAERTWQLPEEEDEVRLPEDHAVIGRRITERIVIVHAPSAHNPNLCAQKGVFTLHLYRYAFDEFPESTSLILGVERMMTRLESVFGERAANEVGKATAQLPLQRLRLQADCAPKLLRLLSERGVDAATLFPGYSGVAQSLKDRRLFE